MTQSTVWKHWRK